MVAPGTYRFLLQGCVDLRGAMPTGTVIFSSAPSSLSSTDFLRGAVNTDAEGT